MIADSVFTLNSYLKKHFGCRVARISFDTGCNCPWNRCVFCREDAFIPRHIVDMSKENWEKKFLMVKKILRKRYKTDKFMAYFQSGTSTFGDSEILGKYYREAASLPGIEGLVISTRPDFLDAEKIDTILESSEKCNEIWLESGLQTVHDSSLQLLNRGHDSESYFSALENISRLAGDRIKVAPHLILGIPGENEDDYMETVKKSLAPDIVKGVKFHHMQVHRGTVLARMYEKQPFRLFDEEEYVDLFSKIIRYVPGDKVVLRMFASAPSELLVGPRWETSVSGMIHKIEKKLKTAIIKQGDLIDEFKWKTEKTSS
ncbi:MAG: TIGR01212 family radical SAM protein [bacterium]